MTPPKRITLEAFVRKYSCANQSEYDVLVAAVNKLKTDSPAHQAAVQCLAKWRELEEYLDVAGFEL
jgi:hypothetical protein